MGGSKRAPFPASLLLDGEYAVASISYRLSEEALFPAQIEDCKAAVPWLRANAARHHLDPGQFGA
jgi:acetyl esterase/lipase